MVCLLKQFVENRWSIRVKKEPLGRECPNWVYRNFGDMGCSKSETGLFGFFTIKRLKWEMPWGYVPLFFGEFGYYFELAVHPHKLVRLIFGQSEIFCQTATPPSDPWEVKSFPTVPLSLRSAQPLASLSGSTAFWHLYFIYIDS